MRICNASSVEEPGKPLHGAIVRPLASWVTRSGGYAAMAGMPRRSPSKVLIDTPSALDNEIKAATEG